MSIISSSILNYFLPNQALEVAEQRKVRVICVATLLGGVLAMSLALIRLWLEGVVDYSWYVFFGTALFVLFVPWMIKFTGRYNLFIYILIDL